MLAKLRSWFGWASLLMVLVFCFFYMTQVHQSSPEFHGTLLVPAKAIPAFELEDTHQQAFTNANLKHHWTWLFLGFTECPQLCPTTMAHLAKAYKKMQQQKRNVLPQVVMVTLDPHKDTPEKLSNYVHAFDPNFQGLTGTESQISALAKSLGVSYTRQTGQPIEHTGVVMVINPSGQLQALFTTPFNSDFLVEDHQSLIQKFVL